MSKTYRDLTAQEKNKFLQDLKSVDNLSLFFNLIQVKFKLENAKPSKLTQAMFANAILTALSTINPEVNEF